MLLPSHTLFESGVDWITVTSKADNAGRIMHSRGVEILESERQLGNDIKPWQHKGYEGWTSGHCEVGRRFDSSIVRLHGHLARESWFDVYQESTNCSRLDLQVTARFEDTDPAKVIAKCYSTVKRSKYLGKEQKWHLRRDCEHGDTLEVGRRVSEKFGRIYDKWRESSHDHYRNCVRFELELKKRAARWNCATLSDGRSSHSFAIATVQSYFKDRGVLLRLTDSRDSLERVPPMETDIERWLRWASTGVRPRCQEFVKRGRIQELLDCLGLSSFVSVDSKHFKSVECSEGSKGVKHGDS